MTTIILAQAIGLLLLLHGMNLFFNKHMKDIIADLGRNSALMHLTGFSLTVLGLAVVLGYNDWSSVVAVIISFIGWVTLIKGVMMTIAPKTFMSLTLKCLKSKIYTDICIIITLSLSAYLFLVGFMGY